MGGYDNAVDRLIGTKATDLPNGPMELLGVARPEPQFNGQKSDEWRAMINVLAAISEAIKLIVLRPTPANRVSAEIDNACDEAMRALCNARAAACSRLKEIEGK